jgi:fatty-acyl-CoA synthase
MQFYKSVMDRQSFNLSFESKHYSFSEFNKYLSTTEERLKLLNPSAGQFLIFRNTNHILHLTLFLLCEKFGLVFIPIFEGTSDSEFDALLYKLQPDILVTANTLDKSFNFEQNELAPKRAAKSGCIFQTSGTTGVPGFIFQPYTNLFQNAQLTARGQKITKNSIVLSSLPFSHVGGLCMQTTAALAFGCKLTIIQKNETDIFIEELKKSTHAIIVPSYFRILAEIKAFQENVYENFPLVITGSTPVTFHLLKQLVAKKFKTQCVYGLTEIGPYLCSYEYDSNTEELNSENQDSETTLLGKVLPEYSLRTNSESGEIEISGPCMGEKYDPSLRTYSKLAQADNFLPTGDLGKIEGGRLFFKGRRKIFISVGGLKVNPQEVEEKIIEFGQIKACAVVAKKNYLLGEVPVAYIVASAEIKKDLLSYLKKKLSRHKIPQKLFFVESLPLTSIGKNNRPEINKKAACE